MTPAHQISRIRGDFEVLRDVTAQAPHQTPEPDAHYLARVTAALSAEITFAVLGQLRLCLILLARLIVVLLIVIIFLLAF